MYVRSLPVPSPRWDWLNGRKIWESVGGWLAFREAVFPCLHRPNSPTHRNIQSLWDETDVRVGQGQIALTWTGLNSLTPDIRAVPVR